MTEATLVVAWNVGKSTHARQVKATEAVVDHLLEAAAATDAIVSDGSGKPYDPDDEQGESDYIVVDRDELLDPNVEREMLMGPSLPLISTAELRERRLLGYGLVVGDDPDARRLYIKKRSPVQMLSKSLITRFNDTLSHIEDPILAFDPLFDVILDGADVWAISQKNFEGLFKESEAVLALAPTWVDSLSSFVPMKKSAKAELVAMVQRNGVLRRKLQSVLRQPHVQNLTVKNLRKAVKDHSLNVDEILPGGKLALTPSNASLIIGLLNEDFWSGYFSSESWSAGRKSRR